MPASGARLRRINWRTCTGAFLAIVLLSVSQSASAAGDPGDAGALFLRVGMGARAASMGDGYAGVAEDASSVYWNPAAMAAVLGTNIQFTHDEYMVSARLEQIALTHETRYGTLGLSFTGMYMDDMERREDVPTEIPLGNFSVYDASFAVGFARYILPNTSLGATVKPVYQKIDTWSASGWAFDIGLFHVARINGLKLAAVAGNVGAPMKFIDEEYALPRYMKVGGAYERETAVLRGRLLLTLDGVWVNDGGPKQHLGAEYMYQRTLALRAGYKAGYDSYGGTFGAGILYKSLQIDYAFLLVKNDLGDNHRISLGLRL